MITSDTSKLTIFIKELGTEQKTVAKNLQQGSDF